MCSALAKPSTGVAPLHRFTVRVYYEDTDAGGIVYYANYLKFAERARTEWLRHVGMDHAALLRDGGLFFAVRRCAVDYRRPARLDDMLEIATRLLAFGAATIDLEQAVARDAVDLVHLQVRLACVASDGRPARLPAALRAALVNHLPTTQEQA